MEVIDAQVHAWELPSDEFPWDPAFGLGIPTAITDRFRKSPVTADQMVAMMDAVGVDAAVLTSPSLYGHDHSYAFSAAERHLGRYAVVGRLSPATPNIELRVRSFRDRPQGLGVRVLVLPNSDECMNGPGFAKIFATAEKTEVPIFLTAMGRLRELPEIARAYPNLLMILDHLGISMLGQDVDRRLSHIPDLLALAPYDNVVVKCTAAPDLSKEEYPFLDLWPNLSRIIEAFGIERLMWGTDITQHMHEHTYCEAVDYMRRTDQLSDHEKELILGKNLRRLLRWPASDATRAEG